LNAYPAAYHDYGDPKSATKLNLGGVGIDVLGKISGREIHGQDENKTRRVIEQRSERAVKDWKSEKRREKGRWRRKNGSQS